MWRGLLSTDVKLRGQMNQPRSQALEVALEFPLPQVLDSRSRTGRGHRRMPGGDPGGLEADTLRLESCPKLLLHTLHSYRILPFSFFSG